MISLKLSVLPLLAVCLAASAAGAAPFCGDNAIKTAQADWEQEQLAFKGGMISEYEAMIFEKNLLELKLCKNPSDYDSFKALAANTAARADFIAAEYNGGNASKEELALANAEKEMRSNYCRTVLSGLQESVLSSPDQVKTVSQACDLLK